DETLTEGECNDHLIQVYVVSDLCGNTATAEVHYILDRDPGDAVLVCRQQINLSLDENCKATITPELLLVNFQGCAEDFEVRPKPGYTLLPGNMVDGSYVGMTIPVMVVDPLSQNRCWTLVTIEDKLAPVLTCGADTVQCNEDISPASTGFPVPDDVTVIDQGDGTFILQQPNCGPTSLEFFDEIILHNC